MTANQFRKVVAEWVLYAAFAMALIFAFPHQPWWAFAVESMAAWIIVKFEVGTYVE